MSEKIPLMMSNNLCCRITYIRKDTFDYVKQFIL